MLEIIKPKISYETESKNYGRVIVSPLERGYATTFGNILRRMLLSSLPGTAVSAVKIEGVKHELSTITGVKEDVVEIILNIKQLVLKNDTDETKKATLKVKADKRRTVTAEDIEFEPGVEAVDKKQIICSLEPGAEIHIEFRISNGWGYVPSDVYKEEHNLPIGWIVLDASYSPIEICNFSTEKVRVENRTDFDKLILEVKTNGAMDPKEAVAIVSNMLIKHLELLVSLTDESVTEENIFETEKVKANSIYDVSLETIGLSKNVLDKLNASGLTKIQDVKVNDLKEIEELTDENIKEIEDAISVLENSVK